MEQDNALKLLQAAVDRLGTPAIATVLRCSDDSIREFIKGKRRIPPYILGLMVPQNLHWNRVLTIIGKSAPTYPAPAPATKVVAENDFASKSDIEVETFMGAEKPEPQAAPAPVEPQKSAEPVRSDEQEKLADALRELCQQHSKYSIARKIGGSPDTLRKITNRGGKMGDIIRQKLDEHFPGWRDVKAQEPLPAPQPEPQVVTQPAPVQAVSSIDEEPIAPPSAPAAEEKPVPVAPASAISEDSIIAPSHAEALKALCEKHGMRAVTWTLNLPLSAVNAIIAGQRKLSSSESTRLTKRFPGWRVHDQTLLAAALTALCKKEGGHKKISRKIKCSKGYIPLVISGKLKLGPAKEEMLDACYPGWQKLGQVAVTSEDAIIAPSRKDALKALCEEYSFEKVASDLYMSTDALTAVIAGTRALTYQELHLLNSKYRGWRAFNLKHLVKALWVLCDREGLDTVTDKIQCHTSYISSVLKGHSKLGPDKEDALNTFYPGWQRLALTAEEPSLQTVGVASKEDNIVAPNRAEALKALCDEHGLMRVSMTVRLTSKEIDAVISGARRLTADECVKLRSGYGSNWRVFDTKRVATAITALCEREGSAAVAEKIGYSESHCQFVARGGGVSPAMEDALDRIYPGWQRLALAETEKQASVEEPVESQPSSPVEEQPSTEPQPVRAQEQSTVAPKEPARAIFTDDNIAAPSRKDAFKALCDKHGIYALAWALHLPTSAIYAIMSGKRKLTPNECITLTKHYPGWRVFNHDLLVAALNSLCEKAGGVKKVSRAIQCSVSYIPSLIGGHIRLGPSMEDKLDARYPGWQRLALTADKQPTMAVKEEAASDTQYVQPQEQAQVTAAEESVVMPSKTEALQALFLREGGAPVVAKKTTYDTNYLKAIARGKLRLTSGVENMLNYCYPGWQQLRRQVVEQPTHTIEDNTVPVAKPAVSDDDNIIAPSKTEALKDLCKKRGLTNVAWTLRLSTDALKATISGARELTAKECPTLNKIYHGWRVYDNERAGDALYALCLREGGFRVVAKKSGCLSSHIKSICKGETRFTPSVEYKLNASYPGWQKLAMKDVSVFSDGEQKRKALGAFSTEHATKLRQTLRLSKNDFARVLLGHKSLTPTEWAALDKRFPGWLDSPNPYRDQLGGHNIVDIVTSVIENRDSTDEYAPQTADAPQVEAAARAEVAPKQEEPVAEEQTQITVASKENTFATSETESLDLHELCVNALRAICREPGGVDYAVATFHMSAADILSVFSGKKKLTISERLSINKACRNDWCIYDNKRAANALRALCQREGGVQTVAEKTGYEADWIKQYCDEHWYLDPITAYKLNAEYPGWQHLATDERQEPADEAVTPQPVQAEAAPKQEEPVAAEEPAITTSDEHSSQSSDAEEANYQFFADKKLRFIDATDDFMEPTIPRDGIVAVDTTQTNPKEQDGIYVLRSSYQSRRQYIRRLINIRGKVLVSCDNKVSHATEFLESNLTEVIGRVIGVWRPF